MSPTTTSQPSATRTEPVHLVPDEFDAAGPVETASSVHAGSTAMEWVESAPESRRKIRVGVEFDGRDLVVVGVRLAGGHPQITRLLSVTFERPPTAEQLAHRLCTLIGDARASASVVLTTTRAVVRHFHLPPVPARQRQRAALWEGQKVVPFPLNDQEAAHGMSFASAGADGWRATLVAVPRDDAAPILGAIAQLGWKLRSVSVAGTERRHQAGPTGAGAEDGAVVVWSGRRGAFCVFRDGQLTFHYSLGPMPTAPAESGDATDATRTAALRRWINTMEAAVADAFDFHLHVDPSRAPERLTIIGLPAAAAPLLTDWQSRFGAGVNIVDPTDELAHSLPAGVVAWLVPNAGEIAPALYAAAYGVTVDLTPPSIRQRQYRQRLTRLARGTCLVSLAATFGWSGLLWARVQNAHRALARAQTELAVLQTSPVAKDLASAREALAQQRTQLATVLAPRAWMPWIKTILATLPENGRLTNVVVSAESQDPHDLGATLLLRLEGTLSSDGPAHALTYRAWAERLEQLAGPGRVRLLNERLVDGQSGRRWAFSIQLEPLIRSVTGGTP